MCLHPTKSRRNYPSTATPEFLLSDVEKATIGKPQVPAGSVPLKSKNSHVDDPTPGKHTDVTSTRAHTHTHKRNFLAAGNDECFPAVKQHNGGEVGGSNNPANVAAPAKARGRSRQLVARATNGKPMFGRSHPLAPASFHTLQSSLPPQQRSFRSAAKAGRNRQRPVARRPSYVEAALHHGQYAADVPVKRQVLGHNWPRFFVSSSFSFMYVLCLRKTPQLPRRQRMQRRTLICPAPWHKQPEPKLESGNRHG